MSAAALTQTPSPSRLPLALRRFGAVFAGLFTIFAASTALDVALHAAGVFPPVGSTPMSDGLFLLAFSYRAVICIAGCRLTARLAPDRPMGHALALGGIGLLLSTAGAAAMWDAGPAWYMVGLAATALPFSWIGGRLHAR